MGTDHGVPASADLRKYVLQPGKQAVRHPAVGVRLPLAPASFVAVQVQHHQPGAASRLDGVAQGRLVAVCRLGVAKVIIQGGEIRPFGILDTMMFSEGDPVWIRVSH